MYNNLVELLRRQDCKNIVIYGQLNTNIGTIRKLKTEFRTVQMDFEKKRGSIEELGMLHPDAIILTKGLISRQDIFVQLMKYCQEQQAAFYDLRGRDLTEVCIQAAKAAEKAADLQQILKAVEEHDIISFDIFDTLLTRNVLLPEDVFSIMGRRLETQGILVRNFREKRLKAQEELGLTNPNIYQIYERFQKKYRITEEQAQKFISLELQIEKEVLIPREDMLDVYKKCLAEGKRVFLVTDMYIPEKLLLPILEKNGIIGYERLYISCDAKQLKLQGLLETYQAQADGKKYLHIGDHLIHDGICAGLAGIDYCLIDSGYKLAQKTVFAKSIELASSLEEHVMLGMVIARLFNSPFIEITGEGRLLLTSEYDYGYGFCAPLVSKFALWLYEVIRKEKVDDILFASRDGFLMQKLYLVIRERYGDEEMPQGIYFYTSRKAAVMTSITNEAFINMIIDISKEMPPRKMMRERFGLAAKDILPYDEKKYENSIHKYVWAHAPAIFARADVARRNYFKYMGNIHLSIGKKYAFMDFVSSGTCQKSLARIAPFELKGFYAGWNGTEKKEDVGVNALFEDTTAFFMRRYKIMETFMTSYEPSVSHFNDNGEPVFSYEDRSKKELNFVACMQKACTDYLSQFISLFLPKEIEIKNDFVDYLFSVSDKAGVCDGEAVLNHLSLMDDWRKKRNHIEQLIH